MEVGDGVVCWIVMEVGDGVVCWTAMELGVFPSSWEGVAATAAGVVADEPFFGVSGHRGQRLCVSTTLSTKILPCLDAS